MFAQLGCDVLSTTDVARVLDDNTDSKPQWRLYRFTLAENLSRTANCIQYALQHIFSVAEMHSSSDASACWKAPYSFVVSFPISGCWKMPRNTSPASLCAKFIMICVRPMAFPCWSSLTWNHSNIAGSVVAWFLVMKFCPPFLTSIVGIISFYPPPPFHRIEVHISFSSPKNAAAQFLPSFWLHFVRFWNLLLADH